MPTALNVNLISFVFIAICFPPVNLLPRCHLNPLHFNNYWKSVMQCALVIWNQTQIILLGEIIFILQVKIRNSWQFTPQSLDSKSLIHEWCIYVYTCIHTQVSVCTIYGFVSIHNRNQWNMNWFTDALLLREEFPPGAFSIIFNLMNVQKPCTLAEN